MQRDNNNNGVHPACAACKHQRKKCDENCILAPYFPAEKGREFQAVHKVFGVSNATKIVRNANNEEDRKKIADSLIWEAFCRQKDPVLGPYGEYRRIYEELSLYKRQQQNQIMMSSSLQQDHVHEHQSQAAVTSAATATVFKMVPVAHGVSHTCGWNNNNNSHSKRLIDVEGTINNVALQCLNHDVDGNSLVDFTSAYGISIPSHTEKTKQDKAIHNTTTIVPIQCYTSDVAIMNGKTLESTRWDNRL